MYRACVSFHKLFSVAASAVGLTVGVLVSGCTTTTYSVLPTSTSTLPPTSPPTSAPNAADPPPEELLNGVYTTLVGQIEAQWTIKSSCADAVCTATISSSNGGWTGDAALANGRWDLTVVRPDGTTCRNGTAKPSTNHYSWDAATLVGTVDSSYDAVCAGEPASNFHDTFTIVTPPISVSS